MQKEIGGYLSLELTAGNPFLHDTCYCVNSGRNALELILLQIQNIKKLWIPYYTCEVILEPLRNHNISYDFYAIDKNLEIADNLEIHSGEYLLLTNYFGIKDAYIRKMAKRYENRLIVDNAQAYFCSPLPGIYTFYSPRKFVGIPDGGIASIDNVIDLGQYPIDSSWNRCSHLLKRLDLTAEAGYADFKHNSYTLVEQPIKQMSSLTRALLHSIDFEQIKEKRKDNFSFLHQKLGKRNALPIGEIGKDYMCPMVYPYYSEDENLRERLIDNKIFVATYWPNVLKWCNVGSCEYDLAVHILPIPIDQRYTKEEMRHIVHIINQKI